MREGVAVRGFALFGCLWSIASGCSRDHAKHAVGEAGPLHLADKTAGKACKRDMDCPNGVCLFALPIEAMTGMRSAPGGYCSAACTTDADCGRDGKCSVAAGESSGMCRGGCLSNSDCRQGYACVEGGSMLGVPRTGTCLPMQTADTLGDEVAGRACAGDADCLGGACASASPVGAPYPGNYCTGRCWKDGDCGRGGACLVVSGTAEAGWCFVACASDADCSRAGYRCMQLAPAFDACFPAPESLPDNTAGQACAGDGDCGGGAATCVDQLPFATLSSYDEIAAPGGYCTLPCALDSECGASGVCISHGLDGGLCLASCNDASECRDGYECLPDGRDATSKVCVPR